MSEVTGTDVRLDGANIGVGTVGAGCWFSFDGGGKFRHVYRHLNPEGNVRSMVISPHDPARVYAVSDRAGLFTSPDRGYMWEPVNHDLPAQELWSLACHPTEPDTLFVGGRPGLFRSRDAGVSFEELDTNLGPNCPIGIPRVTNVVIDPADPQHMWMGVEVDGVYRSTDGGDSWARLPGLGETPFHDDIHGLALRRDADGAAQLLATTPFGLATSDDGGEQWSWREFDGFAKGSNNPYAYCRGVFVWPGDPETVLIGCGDYIPGRVGAVEVSRDGGASFERATMSHEPNSTVYWMATHPQLPGQVVAASVFGQVFVSSDTGHTWDKLDREFGEIRSVTLTPAG